MGKTRVEVCLISGRGLRGSTTTALLWKTQWFAVGWIDPNDKYCTKIDAPGTGNPVWRTKFSSLVGNYSPAAGLDLHVEVYSRDPLFLREKLLGTATVVLREFLSKRNGNEETGSYQLRKKNSDKARGFVDVSIRVFGEGQEHDPFPNSFQGGLGDDGVVMLVDHENAIALATESASTSTKPQHPTGPSLLPLAAHRVDNPFNSQAQPYTQPTPFPTNFSNHSVVPPSYPRAPSPNFLNLPSRPLIPRPLSTLLPSGYNNYYRPSSYHLPVSEYPGRTYINMPSSGAAAGAGGGISGFGMGAGVAALGAGGFLFGDEFLSGTLDVLEDRSDPSLAFSLDPLF